MRSQQRLRRDVGPRQREGALKRRLIGARESHIGVALLAPSAGHGAEDIGLCLDKYRLLFWIKLDHAPVVVRITERGKDALARAKIGVSLVCAFDDLGQAQSNAAEAVGRHGSLTSAQTRAASHRALRRRLQQLLPLLCVES